MVYLIAYDLNGAGKDYEAIERAIKVVSKGKGVRCLRSTWIIQSDLTSSDDISSLIRDAVDFNDDFVVVKVAEHPHGRLPKNALDFIKSLRFR